MAETEFDIFFYDEEDNYTEEDRGYSEYETARERAEEALKEGHKAVIERVVRTKVEEVVCIKKFKTKALS